MAFLVINIFHGIGQVFLFKEYSLLFYIINILFYVGALYYVAFAYKDFRLSGGIHGKEGKKTKTEKQKGLKEQLVDAATSEVIKGAVNDLEKGAKKVIDKVSK